MATKSFPKLIYVRWNEEGEFWELATTLDQFAEVGVRCRVAQYAIKNTRTITAEIVEKRD